MSVVVEERVLNQLIMTENFDLFLLLASKNVPHIFDKIFSGVGAVTLANLSAASAQHRDIVRSSRVAATKIRSWRRMMEAPPRRRRRILRTEPGADTPLVPCARVRGDTVMAAELSDKTTVRGWSLAEDRVTETITVEEHFPLPVFALDFDRDIVTVVCADTAGVPFSPGSRLVRIYCRRRRVLLSVCSPWPQHSLTALLLHHQWLVTAARDTSDLAVTSVRDPQLPAAAARLAHHRDPVLDLAAAGAALVTLSAAQLLVWTLGGLGPALPSAEIAVAKKCSRVSVSWPLAAVAVSDLGRTQIQVRGLYQTKIFSKNIWYFCSCGV